MDTFRVRAIIEIPYGSSYKYEADKDNNGIFIDRPLPYPISYNYGYVPETLHDDGDPLDVCVLGFSPIYPLTSVKVEILGAFICMDNGVSDDKLVGIVVGDKFIPSIQQMMVDAVEQYLSTYKAGFEVKEFVSAGEAEKIYLKDSSNYWKKGK